MCRVAAVFNFRFAASMVRTLLFAMQHGGQDSCGIGVSGQPVVRGLGLVDRVFSDYRVSQQLPGKHGIGQIRYATQGTINIVNAAPFQNGDFIISHNGHIVNYDKLKAFLVGKGIRFDGTNDGELMLNLIVWKSAQNGGDVVAAIRYAMKRVRGAFSIVLLTPNALYAYRDRLGFRPLVIGKKNRAYLVTSETCALDVCGARYVREVKPGEIVKITKTGIESFNGYPCNGCQFCIFEPIYFAFPSSIVYGMHVWKFQRKMGTIMANRFRPTFEKLLEQYGPDKIVIGPIPDTPRDATLAFCRTLGAMDLYDEFLCRSHFAGRTFMGAEQLLRDLKVKLKFAFVKEKVKGKVVVVLDDSIVRGSTLKKIARILKEKCGALAVYVVIYSPQIIGPCSMGIDTPTRRELVACRIGDVEKVRRHLSLDGLLHCSVQDLMDAVEFFGLDPKHFCTSCFTGHYRIRVNTPEK